MPSTTGTNSRWPIPSIGCGVLLGDKEVDKRFSSLQRRVAFATSRRALHASDSTQGERFAISPARSSSPATAILGFTPPITRSFRGLVDFIYYAQYESQSDKTLEYLTSALQQFHVNKEALSRAGVRNGKQMKGLFNIPKLELMQNAARYGEIARLAASVFERSNGVFTHPQRETPLPAHKSQRLWPPDVPGSLIATRKFPFSPYISSGLEMWKEARTRASRLQAGDVTSSTDSAAPDSLASGLGDYESEVDLADDEDEDDEDEDTSGSGVLDPQSRTLRLEQFARLSSFFLRDSIRDAFADKTRPQNGTTAFILRRDPEAKNIQIEQTAEVYGLPDFRRVLNDYYFGFNRSQAHAQGALPFVSIDIWSYVRLQMRLLQDNDMV